MLDGKAYDFYESSSDEMKQNYQQLRAAFITHFQPNKSKLVRWNDLCQKALTIGQSIVEYHDELMKEVSKIGGVTDEQLMIVFLNGLPVDIKEHVALQEPISLAEALKKAGPYESIECESKKELIRSLVLGKQKEDAEELMHAKDKIIALRLEIKELRKSENKKFIPPQKDEITEF